MWAFLTHAPLCTFIASNFFLHSQIYWVWDYVYLYAVTVIILPPHSWLHEMETFIVLTWYYQASLEECPACN